MARKISVEIVGDSRSLVNAFRRSSREATKWNSGISRAARGSIVASVGFSGLGRSIAFASGAFVGGAGLTAALKASVEGFTKFEDQMQKTVGLANVAQSQVRGFSKEILALGPQIGKGPQELAEAFFFVASSGIKAAKAMEVVKAAGEASISGLGDTATVADALTSVINAYGQANINAAQAADVLTATVREGKGEASQFAPVIGNVVALASQLGVSFDQVGAALAVQTRLGTDAETTAIQLQRVFSTLLKVTPKSAAAFESVGLSADKLREQLGTKNGLIKVLQTVKAAFQGNNPALAQAFGDVRALRGILNLVGKQTKSTQEVFDKLAHSTGSAKKAFDAVNKDTAQQFRKLKASAQVLGISLGAIFAPLAAKAAQGLTVVATHFTEFVNKIQKAKGFKAKFDVVTTGLTGLGNKLGRDLLREFNKIDFAAAGRVAGDKVSEAFDALRRKFDQVDWENLGKVIVQKIATFLKNVNWVKLFTATFKLMRTAMQAGGKLFVGAGEELMKQLLHGIEVGAKLALLFVEKFAVQLVRKMAGATSFLGRFDPFKGVKEKADLRLKQIQRAIDDLHGKTVDIDIVVNTRGGGPAGQARRRDSGAAFQKSTIDKASQAATSVVDTAAIAAAKARAAAKAAAAKAEKARDDAQKAFQSVISAFSLAEERAAATKALRDDIRVQKDFQAAILAEMRIEGKTNDLQTQLFESRQKVLEFQRQQAEAQIALKKKTQFLQLGLTEEGDKRTPGAGSLLRRTHSLQQLIKGTPLDTKKTVAELNRIVRVLQGKFGKVGRDVRQAILDMLNDISDALDGNGSKRGPLTKTHGLNTKQIVAGLGLDETQIRELRSRLSGFNTAGRALGGTAETAARSSTRTEFTRGGRRDGDTRVVVESHVTVNLDGEVIGRVVTRSQQKRHRRNPGQKRGPHR